MTRETLLVLDALSSAERLSGAQIAKTAKLASGTLYPILSRLERAGWLSSEWELLPPEDLGRPRRRYYRLTGVGAARARAAARELHAPIGRLAWS